MEELKTKKSAGRLDRPNPFANSAIEGGKLPPQAIELEEAVLGAILMDSKALNDVIDALRPEAFYDPRHQQILDAIMRLFNESKPIDLLTVTEKLRDMGHLDSIGGPFYISQLTNKVASTANAEVHARIITQKHILRELIRISSETIRDAFDETTDVFDLLDKTESNLYGVSEGNLRRSYDEMGSLMKEAIHRIEEVMKMDEGVSGVPSGFKDLDKITSGWQPSDMVVIAARPGMGKCLGKGTPVIMYDGTIKVVEDIQVGDLLMGDDSTPRTVGSLARGREEMYWVRQTYGMDYRVNESHILTVRKSREDSVHEPRGTITDLPLKDLLAKSDKWQNDHKGFKVAIDYTYSDVDIDPYFLGLWLGDGKSDNSVVYTQDKEISEYLYEYADQRGDGIKVIDQDRCPGYRITKGYTGRARFDSLQSDMNKMGLIGNKHIPQEYISNSREIRLQLLAGLIDSDGHLNTGHGETYEITQKNEALALQIKYLCDSLGYRTSFNRKMARISSIGFEGEVFRVRFNGDVDAIPVRVPRKQASPWKSNQDWRNSGLSLEPDGVDDYFGFTLDGNHRFLLGDGTVTHNTAFVLSMARNIAVDYQRPVAIFSLEMASIQLVQRLISSETEIPLEKLRKGNLRDDEFAQLHARIGKLSKAPLFIDDTPALSVFELRAKCRRLKQQHNIELIIIDYLQLMTAGSDKGNREQEISTISRSIKSIAKELNVPVIALSQLNRSVETRGGDKKPQLSDLRESGAIEQDADLVSFIYRPEYYGITEYEDGMPTHGVGEFIVAKHRNGALDSVKLSFRGELAKFSDLESFNFNEPLDPLNPDTGFADASPTITMPSKMNDEWDNDGDDAPF